LENVGSLLKFDWNIRFFSGLLAGSLIKLVYFSRHEDQASNDMRRKTVKERLGISNGNRRSYPILGGRLHFVKFETSKINDCLDFIYSKQLHHGDIP
jgi:pantothenate kinase